MSLSGPKSVSPEFNVLQKENAGIARDQWDDFKNRFSGIQRDLVFDASNTGQAKTKSMEAARMAVNNANTANQAAEREFLRKNVNLDAGQRDFINRQRIRDKSKLVGAAANKATRDEADRQDNVRQSIMSINRGQANEALGEFGTAAQLENSAGIQDLQNRQNRHASKLNTASTLGGLGLAAFILSSKDKKKNIKSMDTKKAAQEVDDIDLKNYEYKDGAGPSGTRHGAIAEDMPDAMTTPDKKLVDLGDWTAKNTAAIQEVKKKVDQIEKSVRSLNRG